MKTKNYQFRRLISSLLILSATLTVTVLGNNETNSNAVGKDVVLRWNRVIGQTLGVSNDQPPTINPVRSLAMMHLAMF